MLRIGELDWSAQEVSHLLPQLPVHNSSQEVVSLDCQPEEVQDDLIVLESSMIGQLRLETTHLTLEYANEFWTRPRSQFRSVVHSSSASMIK